jgi:hypothetical protein
MIISLSYEVIIEVLRKQALTIKFNQLNLPHDLPTKTFYNRQYLYVATLPEMKLNGI